MLISLSDLYINEPLELDMQDNLIWDCLYGPEECLLSYAMKLAQLEIYAGALV